MGDYTGRIDINRPAEEAFGFLADIGNMPLYLPSVRQARAGGGDRIVLEGEAEGHAWQAEGWMDVDRDRRRMRWGSDALVYYKGELQVSGQGERCQVELRLHLVPLPHVAARMAQKSGSVEAGLKQALERTLENIRHAVEGNGAPRAKSQPGSRLYGRSATMNPDIS
jgi:uncharacterized membrane protein